MHAKREDYNAYMREYMKRPEAYAKQLARNEANRKKDPAKHAERIRAYRARKKAEVASGA